VAVSGSVRDVLVRLLCERQLRERPGGDERDGPGDQALPGEAVFRHT
jgi:hypothetical protein